MKVGTSTLIDLLHIIFVSFLKEKKKEKKDSNTLAAYHRGSSSTYCRWLLYKIIIKKEKELKIMKLLVPVPDIWGVNMSKKKKKALILVKRGINLGRCKWWILGHDQVIQVHWAMVNVGRVLLGFLYIGSIYWIR